MRLADASLKARHRLHCDAYPPLDSTEIVPADGLCTICSSVNRVFFMAPLTNTPTTPESATVSATIIVVFVGFKPPPPRQAHPLHLLALVLSLRVGRTVFLPRRRAIGLS